MPILNDTSHPHYEYNHYVSRRLREARKEAGLSLKRTAHMIGILYQQLQKIETGINRPSIYVIDAYAALSGHEVAWFLPDPKTLKEAIERSRAYRKKMDEGDDDMQILPAA